MDGNYRRGVLVLLVAGSCWAAGVSSASAQSGPSDNGSTAQTVYIEPTPLTTGPLVPPKSPLADAPSGAPAAPVTPDQQVLPDTDQFAPPSGDDDTGPSGDDDTAPSDQAGAGGADPDGGTDPTAVDTRETGSDASPVEASTLPFTGGLVLPIAVAGLLLLVAGALLRRRTLI